MNREKGIEAIMDMMNMVSAESVEFAGRPYVHAQESSADNYAVSDGRLLKILYDGNEYLKGAKDPCVVIIQKGIVDVMPVAELDNESIGLIKKTMPEEVLRTILKSYGRMSISARNRAGIVEVDRAKLDRHDLAGGSANTLLEIEGDDAEKTLIPGVLIISNDGRDVVPVRDLTEKSAEKVFKMTTKAYRDKKIKSINRMLDEAELDRIEFRTPIIMLTSPDGKKGYSIAEGYITAIEKDDEKGITALLKNANEECRIGIDSLCYRSLDILEHTLPERIRLNRKEDEQKTEKKSNGMKK